MDTSRLGPGEGLAALVVRGPEAAWERLRDIAVAHLRKLRGGRPRWRDAASLDELAMDFVGSLLERWQTIEAYARDGLDLEGLLYRTASNWLADRARARSPHASAGARRWRASIEAQVDAGVCTRVGVAWNGSFIRLNAVPIGRSLRSVQECAAVVDAFAKAAKLRRQFVTVPGLSGLQGWLRDVVTRDGADGYEPLLDRLPW